MRPLDRFCTTLTAFIISGIVTASAVSADVPVPSTPPAPPDAPPCRVVDGAQLEERAQRPSFHFTATPGETRNAPSFLGALGFAKGSGFHIASGVIGVYDFLHSGSQAVVPVGTRFRVVLGDDYLAGACTFS